MTLPKYKINDQVIVLSKSEDINYSLGIIKHGQKNGGEWEYSIIINGKPLIFKESEIMGCIFESKDFYSSQSLKEQEELIKL